METFIDNLRRASTEEEELVAAHVFKQEIVDLTPADASALVDIGALDVLGDYVGRVGRTLAFYQPVLLSILEIMMTMEPDDDDDDVEEAEKKITGKLILEKVPI